MSTSYRKGFTLLEFLLYIAIFSVIMVVVIFFLQAILADKVKNQTVSMTDQEGQEVVLVITQALRNATAITTPLIGTAAASARLQLADSTKSPTIIDLANGTIGITEGSGARIPLTSSRVTASGLTFTNVGKAGTNGALRVVFTLTAQTGSALQEYVYTQTYEGAVTIRK